MARLRNLAQQMGVRREIGWAKMSLLSRHRQASSTLVIACSLDMHARGTQLVVKSAKLKCKYDIDREEFEHRRFA
jgi:hypothetical protein